MAFQENLRFYREKAGYRQAKDFAAAIGLSYTTYIAYENQGREPKYETLRRIAEALNVSIDTLLGFSGVDRYEEFKRLVVNSGCSLEEDGEKVIVHMASFLVYSEQVSETAYMIDTVFEDKEAFCRCVNEGLARFENALTHAKYDYIRREIMFYNTQQSLK